MRVWVDITDSSHVVFLAPLVRRLEDQGHVVTITARRFASAELVLRRYGLAAMVTSRHRGGGLGTRAVGLLNRTAQLMGSASSGRFDVAVGSHASDFVLTAFALGVPQMTLLDDDRLTRSNKVNVRLVDLVAVPEAVPVATLRALGTTPDRVLRYPGFREEYYLRDAEPDPQILDRLGVAHTRVVGVVRPSRQMRKRGEVLEDPPAGELEHFVCELARRRNVTLVFIPRSAEQARRFRALELKHLVVPDGPVDAVSLLAAADFVVGAGGVMEREAVALGTPAYSLSRRPPGAVDAALLADGRLRRITAAAEVVARRKETRGPQPAERRDPQLFVHAILRLAERRNGTPRRDSVLPRIR